jgi:hypothetical protein
MRSRSPPLDYPSKCIVEKHFIGGLRPAPMQRFRPIILLHTVKKKISLDRL